MIRQVDMPATISAGQAASVRLIIENKGVAPFYFDWPVVLSFMDEDGTVILQTRQDVDIRQWLPGNHVVEIQVTLPVDIGKGVYDVRLAIHDPETDQPGILFANDGKDEAGRYLIGRFMVE